MRRSVLTIALLLILASLLPPAAFADSLGKDWNIACGGSINPTAKGYVWFNGRAWAFGEGGTWSSVDGANWKLQGPKPAWMGSYEIGHNCIVFKDKIWLIGGTTTEGMVDAWSSSDGVNWTAGTKSAPWSARTGHACAVFNDRIWVIGGRDSAGQKNDVWSSADGVSWSCATAAADWHARDKHSVVVHNGKLWSISGDIFLPDWTDGTDYGSGSVWYTDNGTTWTEAVTTFPWRAIPEQSSVEYNGRIWVFGNHGKVYSSADGAQWREDYAFSSPLTRSYPYLVLDGRPILAANAIWSIGEETWVSPDGMSWRRSPLAPTWETRENHTLLDFHNRLWIVGGDLYHGLSFSPPDPPPPPVSGVWSSAYGSYWTTETMTAGFLPRTGHASVVFGDKMWVLGGGEASDVWNSADGKTWTKATATAPWASRSGHAAVVHNNRMWILGGGGHYTTETYKCLNSVWSSKDGVTWKCAAPSPPWSPRTALAALSFKGRIWVMGGYGWTDERNWFYSQYRCNDVWSSADGTNWRCETEATPWSYSYPYGLTAAVVGDRMYAITVICDYFGYEYVSRTWSSDNGGNWRAIDNNLVLIPYVDYPLRSVVTGTKFWVMDYRRMWYADILKTDIPSASWNQYR